MVARLEDAGPDPFGCPVCGQLLARPGACPNRWCRRPDRGFSVVHAVGVHRGALRRAIARYKYRGERGWADVFASMGGRSLDANCCWFEEFDLLAGVPTYTGPSARRDWDPVGEILDRLEPALQPGWRVVPNAIVKVAETPGMQGRTWAERQRL